MFTLRDGLCSLTHFRFRMTLARAERGFREFIKATNEQRAWINALAQRTCAVPQEILGDQNTNRATIKQERHDEQR